MNWEEEYKKIVLDGEENFKVNNFLRSHLPKFLYKYCDFNLEYWKDRLFKGELYFCPANKLNDTFEGVPKIDLVKALEEGTNLNKTLRQVYGIPKGEKLELSPEQIEDVLKKMQEKVHIASLSEVNDSDSMWERYSDKHKGFCIQYDVSKMSDLKKNMLYKVIYREKPDITKITQDLADAGDLFVVIFKPEDWSCEKEWRMFKIRQDEEGKKPIIYYFKREISAVYLGRDCEEENKKIILDWAKKENKEVYQMINSLEQNKLISKKII